MDTKMKSRSGSGSKVRKRMSDCLSDLAAVLPINSYNSSRGKLDKMEVVQLAVKYLNHMNEVSRERKNESHSNSPTVHVCDFMKLSEEDRMKEFNRGFNESINQTVQYLTKNLGVKSGSTLVVKLVNHLLANLESINACANASDERLTSGERLHSSERLSSERLEIDIALTPVESAQLLSSPPPMNPEAILTCPVIRREVSTQTPSFQAFKPSVSVPTVSVSPVSVPSTSVSPVSDGKQTLLVTNNYSSNQTPTSHSSNQTPAFHQSNQTPTFHQQNETSINQSMGTRIRDSSKETPINHESPETLVMNKDCKHFRFWRVQEEQTPDLSCEKRTPTSIETQISVSSESNVDKKRKLALPSLINQNELTNETGVDEKLINGKLINETPNPKKISLSCSESLSSLSSVSSHQSVSPSIDSIPNRSGSEVKDQIISNADEMPNEGVSSHEKVSKCLAFKKSITLRYQTQVDEETPTSNGEVAPPRRTQTPKESVETLQKLVSMQNRINIPSIKSPSTEHAQSSTLRTLLSDHSSSNLAPNHSQLNQTQSHQIPVHRDASRPKHFSNSTPTHSHRVIYHQNQEVAQSMMNSSTMKSRSDPLIVQSKNDSLIVKSRNDPSSRSAPTSVINDALKRRGWEYSSLMSDYQRPCCPHADQVAPPHHLISAVRHPFLGVRSHPYPMPPHPYYHRQAPCLIIEANQNKLMSSNQLIPSNQQMNLNQLMSMRNTYQPFHHTHLAKAKTLESKYFNQSNQRL